MSSTSKAPLDLAAADAHELLAADQPHSAGEQATGGTASSGDPAHTVARRMAEELPDSARRVQQALTAAGISAQVLRLPRSTRTASDAAAAIGCRVEQIAKSLVFRRADSNRPVLIIASGRNRVDEALVSAYLNISIAKADADFVRSATGFAIGGVPPLGHALPLETLLDQDLLQFDVIWAAAGTPRAVFSINPHQLACATHGRVLAISASCEQPSMTPAPASQPRSGSRSL